jgi:hypothetical protein
MTPTELRRALLDLAVDDYTGLWEVLWLCQGKLPDADLQQTLVLARCLVKEMLRDGSLQLYLGSSFTGDERQVLGDDRSHLLESDIYWNEPLAEYPHLRVVATEQGEREYMQ